MPFNTREEWLREALNHLAVIVHETTEYTVDVSSLQVSVGFPKVRGRIKAIGQCFDSKAAGDKKSHIFICPTQIDPVRILDIELHEIGHALLGSDAGHGKEFGVYCKAVGLVKPWTQTTASEELRVKLEKIAEELGEYPHGALVPTAKEKKKGSTLKLWMCECETKLRVGRQKKPLNATCNDCNSKFAIQNDEDEESKPEPEKVEV